MSHYIFSYAPQQQRYWTIYATFSSASARLWQLFDRRSTSRRHRLTRRTDAKRLRAFLPRPEGWLDAHSGQFTAHGQKRGARRPKLRSWANEAAKRCYFFSIAVF